MSTEDDLIARITKRTKGFEVVKYFIDDEMKKSSKMVEDQVIGMIFLRIENFDVMASQGKGPIFSSYIPPTNKGVREALLYKDKLLCFNGDLSFDHEQQDYMDMKSQEDNKEALMDGVIKIE